MLRSKHTSREHVNSNHKFICLFLVFNSLVTASYFPRWFVRMEIMKLQYCSAHINSALTCTFDFNKQCIPMSWAASPASRSGAQLQFQRVWPPLMRLWHYSFSVAKVIYWPLSYFKNNGGRESGIPEWSTCTIRTPTGLGTYYQAKRFSVCHEASSRARRNRKTSEKKLSLAFNYGLYPCIPSNSFIFEGKPEKTLRPILTARSDSATMKLDVGTSPEACWHVTAH